MKAIAYLQRRHRSSTAPSISLFPFLAVLICTMGALVPLLLAISRTARLQAEAAAAAKVADVDAETQMEREMVQWRVEQLKASRTTTEGQLADARLELGHIEDHARRLRAQLASYEQTFNDLDRLSSADGRQRTEAEQELQQMQGKIVAAQQDLEQTRRAASKRTPSFAVVPYEGPNQTRRRPIYLECRADCVVLQPEGIVFVESDFEGPLGPGNPLAVALRSAREHMLSQQHGDQQAGEPYPLLLVRPEGINAYYAARAAMKSWGFEFGYELVEEQWKLSYPKTDQTLVNVLKPLIVSARREQAMLIAAAPSEYKDSKVHYRKASGQGKFIAEDGDAGDGDGGYRSQTPSGRVGRNAGNDGPAGGNLEGDAPYAGDRPYAGDQPYGGLPAGQAKGSNNKSGSGTGGGSVAYAGDQPYAGGGAPAVSHGGVATASGGYPGGTGTGGGPLSGGSGSGTGSGSGGHAGGRGIGDASSPYEVAASAETGNAAGNAAGYAGSAADGPVLAANGGVGGVGGGHAINGQPTGGSVSNAPASGNTLTGNNILTDSNIPTNGTALTSGTSMNGVAPASGQAGDAAIGNGTVMGNSAASSNGAASGNGPASGYATDVQGQPKTGSDGQRASAAGIASTSGSDRMPSGGQPVETPVDYVAGQPPREQSASTATSSDSSGKSRPGRLYRPGEWEDAPEKPPEPPKKSDKDEDKDRFGRKRERPVAEQRGDDWGLHNASRGSMGVTRSIRVECLADKIVVISERGAANNKVIPFGPRTAASVDAFVSAIWEQMDAWGIAGRGMYWRPVLQVHVAPGAEQRFADLSALLEDSGLTVVKK